MLRRTLLLWFLLFVVPLSALAQPEPRSTLEAYALPPDATVELDGHLTEPFWQQADTTDTFTQQEPVEGGTPTEHTVVRVAYDQTHLYIGARLYDRRPDGILAYQLQRDGSLATDDRFMWILDTHADGRSAYFFEINPAGLMGDGLITTGQGTNLNRDWDGIWTARVARDSLGWSAEIQIPFSTLNFDPDQSEWGINFQRTVRRKNEETLWTGYRRNQGLRRPQNAGRLVGLEDASQGLGLEVTPYGLTKADRTWSDGGSGLETASTYDAGVDLSYSFTPSLRGALSVNTDFAETEVDDRRVNLSRFPLRFPEKRDFFLEGSDVFTFAPRSGVEPYFSRNIGLVDGQLTPIWFGTRLTGQVDRYDVGFLQVRTREQGNVPTEDFTVARTRANIFSESTVGAIYTRRATHSDTLDVNDRHTFGTDLELSTSSFRGSDNLQFQAFFVAHNAPAPDSLSAFFDRTTRGVRLNYPNRPFFGHASYREFGSRFDPAVGFTPRNGFRRLQPTVGYSKLLEGSPLLREAEVSLRHEYLMDLDFRPLDVNTTLTFLDLTFESGDQIEASVRRDFERLTFDFDIRRDGSIIIPSGRYTGWSGELEIETASYRRVSGEVELERQSFWTGHRTDYETELTLRPLPGINVSGVWEFSQVRLAEGDFDAHVLRTEAGVDLSPWTSLTSSVQYDNLTGVIGLYSRFRWILQPGSDLYLVYTHNWQDDPTNVYSLSSEAALKLTYSHRF